MLDLNTTEHTLQILKPKNSQEVFDVIKNCSVSNKQFEYACHYNLSSDLLQKIIDENDLNVNLIIYNSYAYNREDIVRNYIFDSRITNRTKQAILFRAIFRRDYKMVNLLLSDNRLKIKDLPISGIDIGSLISDFNFFGLKILFYRLFQVHEHLAFFC